MQPIILTQGDRCSSVGPLTEAELDAAIAFNRAGDCAFEPWHLPHMGDAPNDAARVARSHPLAHQCCDLEPIDSVESEHPWLWALYGVALVAGFAGGWAARALS